MSATARRAEIDNATLLRQPCDDGAVDRATRWIGGVILMIAIWLFVGVALAEIGVAKWLAGLVGILVAVSIVEPRSYLRRGLRQMQARRRAGSVS